MNIDVPGQQFNCPRCGAPGHVAYGGAVYSCHCRHGNYGRTDYAPLPKDQPGAQPLRILSEDDVRRIIREELSSAPHRAMEG